MGQCRRLKLTALPHGIRVIEYAQFKIPPLSNWLFANFAPVGLDGATFGLLMSAMAIIGVILAFPAAFISRRIGLKKPRSRKFRKKTCTLIDWRRL